MGRGMFIVLEGADGSGKTTQFNLLSERLQAVGYDIAVFDFPRYSEPSSHFIQSYLNGGYGPASQVSPYTASLFYALDRYESKTAISEALADGKIVLSNRFAGSNMAHQGSKFTNIAERRGFFIWEDSLEFELLGIPRPDLNIFLRVPAEISYKLVGKKNIRSYTNKKHDEHEGDINHLRQTVETYGQLCKLFPKDFKLIECTKDNAILSIPQINNRIWEIIKPVLPKPKNQPQKRMIHLDKPEQQPAKNSKISLSPSANQSDLLKVNLKTISLLETRRALNHLTANGMITIPKRVNPQSLFVPTGMSTKLTKKYRQLQEMILANYRIIAKNTSVELAQAVLPLSYLVDIHVKGNSSQWLDLYLDLNEYPDNETKQFIQLLTRRLGKRWPHTFKGLELPSSTNVKPPSDFQGRLIGQSNDLNFVSLVNIAPRNELEILIDAIYTSSDLSRGEISTSLDSLSYQQKTDRLADYLGASSVERETLLKKILYELDLMTSGIELVSLLSLDIFNNVQIQPATPRFGYDIPDEIDEAGLGDTYLDCFDLSLGLYSDLQSARHQYDAQYAVLLGSRVRWHGVLDARGFIKLLQTANNASGENRTIIQSIKEYILETHPVIGSSLINLSAQPVISKQKKNTQKQRNQQSSKKHKR